MPGAVVVPASIEETFKRVLLAPMDAFSASYLSLDEYAADWSAMPSGVASTESLAQHLLAKHHSGQLLWRLAVANASSSGTQNPPGVVESFKRSLPEAWQPAFEAAINKPGWGLGRVVAHRQPLLAAIRYILKAPPGRLTGTSPESQNEALLFSHAVAAGLDRSSTVQPGESPSETFETFKAGVQKPELRAGVAGGILGANVELISSLYRTLSLWRDHGSRLDLKRFGLDKEPAGLLRDATGLDLENILAAGLVFYYQAETQQARGGAPLAASPSGEVSGSVRHTLGAFLDFAAATPEEFKEAFKERDGPFDFFPLQQKPILKLGEHLVVLDKKFLLERFTTGLYWSVFDREKRRLPDPAKLPNHWARAFGEMFELSVEEQLRSMAPEPVAGETAVYTEENLGRAYGEGVKRPDVAVYYGRVLGLFEIVSGRVTAAARSQGDLEAFRRDLENKVFHKLRQLDNAATSILEDEASLTGKAPQEASLRIVPVMVQGELFPSEPLTQEVLGELLAQEKLFEQQGVEPPGVVGADELDMLEGLQESRGVEPVQALKEWKRQPQNMELTNYLLQTYGTDRQIYYSTRVKKRADLGFENLQQRAGELIRALHPPRKTEGGAGS